MPTGTVKFFNTQKGYGFIAPEGGGGDIFVHISAVERAGLSTLNEGQRVNFDIENDQKRGKTTRRRSGRHEVPACPLPRLGVRWQRCHPAHWTR